MKVMLATPTYRGLSCLDHVDSLEALILLLSENNIQIQYEQVIGCAYVQVARNELVRRFLLSDCDTLFFLDDDVSFDPYDALRVIMADSPVVAGIYPLKQDAEYYPVVLDADDAGRPILDWRGYLKASRVPTGFLKIERQVFEKIMEANPQLAFTENPLGTEDYTDSFDFFPQGVYNRRWIGEDYAFCDLWTRIGGEIYVIPDIDFQHHLGDTAFAGNLWKFLLKQPGGSDEKG